MAGDHHDKRFATEHFEISHGDLSEQRYQARFEKGSGIVYPVAKDILSQEALWERPGLAEKVTWLQGHDREYGDLYGTLPLIHKMPVGFTISFAFSPQLGSCPKTRHFQGGMSGVVVISRRRPCAACKSRFLLKRCPFCCPPGVNKDHRKISQPRM